MSWFSQERKLYREVSRGRRRKGRPRTPNGTHCSFCQVADPPARSPNRSWPFAHSRETAPDGLRPTPHPGRGGNTMFPWSNSWWEEENAPTLAEGLLQVTATLRAQQVLRVTGEAVPAGRCGEGAGALGEGG